MNTPIKIDVSEIKSYKMCKRNWQFTSRNQFHTTPIIPSDALTLGTVFHEAVGQLYLGASFEAVDRLVRQEYPNPALINILKGYYDNVLQNDLQLYSILEVEHRFNFPSGVDNVECVGAIDLIVAHTIDDDTTIVYGIEHKTCATFRKEAFIRMDEQPRVYFEALDYYIDEAKKTGRIPANASNGGIYINEVKKLLRDFQYNRTLCFYEGPDRDRFWQKYTDDLLTVKETIGNPEPGGELPAPSWMGCQLCQYANVCATYGYCGIDEKTLLEDFSTEFIKREVDHLDEKMDLGKKLT
jgi:hypothetical protein